VTKFLAESSSFSRRDLTGLGDNYVATLVWCGWCVCDWSGEFSAALYAHVCA